MQQSREDLLQVMYEEYQGPLRRVARKAGVPCDDVEDVIQETFISYFRHYALTWSAAHKKAMLMKILKNKCADYFRKARRHDFISMDTEEFDETEILSEFVMKDSLQYVVRDETCKEVCGDIETMKPVWKDIAILGLVEERSIPEICEILELESSVCRMRLSRIRKYLRSCFHQRDSNYPPE